GTLYNLMMAASKPVEKVSSVIFPLIIKFPVPFLQENTRGRRSKTRIIFIL
ncbi:MAG: hypothetical protein RL273_446, partial [Bacteroidota bacterium]